MRRYFYVCSYGGSGSTILADSLKKFGESFHVHSRNPPDILEYIGNSNGGNTYHEWFNGIPVPETELEKYTVIYVYRNPSISIPSRFWHRKHLQHIQTDESITIDDVKSSGGDLFKLKEFHHNYIKPNKNRNYKILCIKFDELFTRQDEISEILGIGKLNIVNKSQRLPDKDLTAIYAELIQEMNDTDSISYS